MTADNTTRRKFKITVMRPVFQIALFNVEAFTRDEAIELAHECELMIKESDW